MSIDDATPEDHHEANRQFNAQGIKISKPATAEQPAPAKNDLPAVWGLVMFDMAQRDNLGAKRYGTRLQAHNGRDMLTDAYQEALDMAVYLRGAIYERDGK